MGISGIESQSGIGIGAIGGATGEGIDYTFGEAAGSVGRELENGATLYLLLRLRRSRCCAASLPASRSVAAWPPAWCFERRSRRFPFPLGRFRLNPRGGQRQRAGWGDQVLGEPALQDRRHRSREQGRDQPNQKCSAKAGEPIRI